MNAKQKLVSILTLTAMLVAATLFHAQASEDQSESNQLAGTWLGAASPGVAPVLVSFLSEGRMILTRPITIKTGPTTFDTVSTGHGEWVRTGKHEYTSTVYLLSSNSSTEFSALVKVTDNIKYDKAANQLTMNGTVAGFDPSGNPLFSFPVTQSFTRIEAR